MLIDSNISLMNEENKTTKEKNDVNLKIIHIKVIKAIYGIKKKIENK